MLIYIFAVPVAMQISYLIKTYLILDINRKDMKRGKLRSPVIVKSFLMLYI